MPRPAKIAIALTLASASLGLPAAGFAADASFRALSSNDGSAVVFDTAEQLVAADTDAQSDAYMRADGATTVLSIGPSGGNGAFPVVARTVSADGSSAVFQTQEGLVAADTDGQLDLYRYAGGTVELVSQAAPGANTNGAYAVNQIATSTDGSVVFMSTDGAMEPGDTDGISDVYQRSGGTTSRLSQGPTGGNSGLHLVIGGIPAADGSGIAFDTVEQLVSGDTDAQQDVYLRSGGTTTLISVGPDGGNGDFWAALSGASPNLGTIVFSTQEALIASDTDDSEDIYRRSGSVTELVSQGDSSNPATPNLYTGISANGAAVYFLTRAGLDPIDTDIAGDDVYARSGSDTELISTGPTGNSVNVDASLAAGGPNADGSRVLFQTNASHLPADGDSVFDVYERSGGTTTLLTPGAGTCFCHNFGAGSTPDRLHVYFETVNGLDPADGENNDVYEAFGGDLTWVSQGPLNDDSASFPAHFAGAAPDGSSVVFKTDEALTSSDLDGDDDLYRRTGSSTELVSVEMIPPQTTLDSTPPDPSNDPTPSFDFSSNEPQNASFECRLDSSVEGDFEPCSGMGTHTTGTLSEGPHTLEVRAIDAAGNADPSPASDAFVVDLTAPAVTIDSGPSGTTAQKTPSFGFSSADGGAGFACRFDADAFAPCSGPGNTHAATLAEGPHVFEVRATDVAGNGSTASRQFTIDATPPETTITGGPSRITRPKATFTFVSSDPAAKFECSLDGRPFASCTSPLTLKKLKPGRHTLAVRSRDALGQVDPTPALRSFRYIHPFRLHHSKHHSKRRPG